MSANDDFSLHDDEELSLHDDASLNGSVPASNKGDAPAKPPQIITTNTLSNIKLPVLQKDDYDTWAMEMEHYLEYIDNEVWKVIQNGNSKKRVTKGKDGVYRVLPPTTQEEQVADEKERKARTLLLMAVPKDHLRRFHGMDDAKEIWAAIKTRFGGNANSKKMQKAVLKQQFEAFTISSKESLEKGYDRFQKLLSQLDALGASVSDEDANHKFLRSLPPAWDSLAMTMRTKETCKPTNLIDCGMSSTVKIGLGYGIKSNAEVLGYEEEISRVVIIPIREQEDIDDSLYAYGKYGPQPQSPSPTESDASSTVYSTCQSNDSDGEQGTVSDHSVNDDPIPIPSIEQVTIATQKTQPQVPKPQQTVDPSCAQHVKTPRQPIRTPVTPSPIPSYNRQNWNQGMQRDLGTGYSFERKPCFVCGSLSHLIKDCDYYEKKMAREAAFKSTRVVHANVRQATPAWTNSNRVNKANQFTPRPVQLNNIRPNLSTASKTIKTGRVNVNTGHGNVSSVSSAGTQFKSGASRFNTGKQHVNSGSVHVNSGTQFKSGASRFNTGKQHVSSGRVNRPVSNNTSPKPSQMEHSCILIVMFWAHDNGIRALIEVYQESVQKWDLLFRGSFLVHRLHNMYTVDMKNVASLKRDTLFISKSHLMKLNCGKEVRSDNGTEFKNRVMLEFCGEKEAARTMLADSHIPTTFWAEAVNTACYTFNRSKSGGWDQFGSNIATALICLSTGRVYNFSKLIFDGQEHAAQAQSQPTPTTPPPIPTSTSPPPPILITTNHLFLPPTPPPEYIPPPPHLRTEPTTDDYLYEEAFLSTSRLTLTRTGS
ncbi:ribonuclease H-like domain-containing protein [Tanacetum coccineum]|uniref:Ribonuclease H-like domain-containing protein n=1 Tax=Tanacetum coccineum TaxID=301880 RepID=A0ABQ5IIH7_9ASTR